MEEKRREAVKPNKPLRVEHLDVSKLLAIALVVWGHCVYGFQNVYGYGNDDLHPVLNFVTSFNMPMFIALSGVFAGSLMKNSFPQLLGKKIKQLLIPPLLWMLMLSLYTFVLHGFDEETGLSLRFMKGWFSGQYWFMQALFLCIITFWFTKKTFRNELLGAVLVSLVIIFLPKTNFRMFNYLLPFFFMGYFLRNLFFDEKRHLLLLTLSLISFILLYRYGTFGVGRWTLNASNYFVDISPIIWRNKLPQGIDWTNIGYAVNRLLIGTAGTLSAILLVKNLHQLILYRLPALARWGQETLGIYMLNQIVIGYILGRFILPFKQPSLLFFNFVIVSIYDLLTLAISLMIIWVLNKHTLSRQYLLGKPA